MSRAMLARKTEAAPAAPLKTTAKNSSGALRIGEPDDAFEQEADRVADAILADNKAGPQWSLSRMSIEAPLQRECVCSGSGKCSTCRGGKTLQRKPVGPAREGYAPSIVHEVLRSPGRPLDQSTRNFFEPRFGHDFGHVRIHTDARSAESAHAVNALAYTVGHSIVIDTRRVSGTEKNRRLLAHELVHTLQQERSSSIALRRQAHDPPELKLVDDFAAKFPAAAKLIKTNPAAMKLVKEAFDAGAKFGGYAEDGPAKDVGRPYTVGNTVYVPKTHAAIPVVAISDFLFELNNAIRQPKFAAIDAAAAAGAKTDLTAAKKYAHDKIEAEVEGMLRLGEVWFETKAKYLGTKVHEFDKYDSEFYLAEYESFKNGKKTKDDIVKDVLQRTFTTGSIKGKTEEQYYIEQYQGLAH
jgi:Domain of unknown function (DUF4157)